MKSKTNSRTAGAPPGPRRSLVRRPAVVTSVTVPETGERRRVFYVRRELLFDAKGRSCPTPLELGRMLAKAIETRDAEMVAGVCWDALNFVHNGNVPKDWLGDWKKDGPTPLAII